MLLKGIKFFQSLFVRESYDVSKKVVSFSLSFVDTMKLTGILCHMFLPWNAAAPQTQNP
jgi:hypothetical protein